jgi:hypothetical protein
MRSSFTPEHLTKARRPAADTAREEARLRADAAWQHVYSETFSRVCDTTLAELLADQGKDAAA